MQRVVRQCKARRATASKCKQENISGDTAGRASRAENLQSPQGFAGLAASGALDCLAQSWKPWLQTVRAADFGSRIPSSLRKAAAASGGLGHSRSEALHRMGLTKCCNATYCMHETEQAGMLSKEVNPCTLRRVTEEPRAMLMKIETKSSLIYQCYCQRKQHEHVQCPCALESATHALSPWGTRRERPKHPGVPSTQKWNDA